MVSGEKEESLIEYLTREVPERPGEPFDELVKRRREASSKISTTSS